MRAITSNVIEKGWGYEEVLHNGAHCVKVLGFRAGGRSSLHYHRNKSETFYVLSGGFVLELVDPSTAARTVRKLAAGDWQNIPSGWPHRLKCGKVAGNVFEASTHHEDSDTFRIEPGDSQI